MTSLPEASVEKWWRNVNEENSGLEHRQPTLEEVLEVAQRIEHQDSASTLALEEREGNSKERERLIEFQLLVQAQDIKRRDFITNVAAARLRIEGFDEANAELLQEVAQEFLDNGRDEPIKEAYDQFLVLLKNYRDQLLGTLMAGLNDQAMMLYNEFNVDDLDADKLAALYLPLSGEQKIEISYRGNPHERLDALKILSEGHIRCLGLAILLAKNMSLESPVMVFDDVVNAIDHDHRRGIRETIFENDHFENTQIIITCHSNEFIKDIQQSLPQRLRADTKVYLLRNHGGNYHPRVRGNLESRNYVDRARTARDELNERGALDAARKAIEMQAEKVWRWLGSYEHGTISVPLHGVGAQPVLRNLCEALRAKLNSTHTFVQDDKQPIITAFNRLLGIPERNLVWEYLNKGTHEEADRDDFDANLVESVVLTVEELDALEMRRGR